VRNAGSRFARLRPVPPHELRHGHPDVISTTWIRACRRHRTATAGPRSARRRREVVRHGVREGGEGDEPVQAIDGQRLGRVAGLHQLPVPTAPAPRGRRRHPRLPCSETDGIQFIPAAFDLDSSMTGASAGSRGRARHGGNCEAAAVSGDVGLTGCGSG
jgi:hypothetical protein